MLTAALTNILEHDNRGNRFTEALLMAAWGRKECWIPHVCLLFDGEMELFWEATWRTIQCGYYEDEPAGRDASPSQAKAPSEE